MQKYAHEHGICRVLLLDLGQCVCYYGWYPVASLARCARVSTEPVETEHAVRLLEVAVYPSSQNAEVQRKSATLKRERHLVSLCTDPGDLLFCSMFCTARYTCPRAGCTAWKFTRFCHGIWMDTLAAMALRAAVPAPDDQNSSPKHALRRIMSSPACQTMLNTPTHPSSPPPEPPHVPAAIVRSASESSDDLLLSSQSPSTKQNSARSPTRYAPRSTTPTTPSKRSHDEAMRLRTIEAIKSGEHRASVRSHRANKAAQF